MDLAAYVKRTANADLLVAFNRNAFGVEKSIKLPDFSIFILCGDSSGSMVRCFRSLDSQRDNDHVPYSATIVTQGPRVS